MLIRRAQQVAQQAPPFRMVARQTVQDIGVSRTGYVLSGPDMEFPLSPSGYLHRIHIPFIGGLATGAGTPAGAFGQYPWLPWSMVRRFLVGNGATNNIVDVSGFGLALLNFAQGRNKQLKPLSVGGALPIDFDGGTNTARRNQAPSRTATVAASTQYPVNAGWTLGISTDDAAMFGLQPMQSNQLNAKLIVRPALASDVVGTITGVVPLTATAGASGTTPIIRPSQESFLVPGYSGSQPDQRFTHAIMEDTLAFPSIGSSIVYKPLPGPTYLRIIGMVENNGLPVANSQTVPAITSIEFRHSISDRPYIETYDQHLQRMYNMYNIELPDGCFVWDWTLGYGIPGIVEPRDFVDTSQLTDVQIAVNCANFTPTNSQIRFVREFLAPAR